MKTFLVLATTLVIIAMLTNVMLHAGTGSTGNIALKNESKIVTKIIDGDTLVAQGNTVRLLGIDTDERGYPCYTVAKKRLEELVLNKDVVLERDGDDKDIYGRFLRYVFLNGTNVNLRMVEEGLAVARFPDESGKYRDEIIDAEESARNVHVGCKWE